ncbi:MAG: hypothetical protein M3268_03030, partial [Acidobacteriota bacterium]|nr:hypothetical protein [Acidobacteriota bacterium]
MTAARAPDAVTTAAREIVSGASAAARSLAESATLSDAGWALVHSVWQLAAVALSLAAALALLRDASARSRYCVACVAMLAMLSLPVATFFALDSRGGPQTLAR